MSFCAICAADIIGHPHFENLGRGDSLVAVCPDCATLDARHYSFDDASKCKGQTPNGNYRTQPKGSSRK